TVYGIVKQNKGSIYVYSEPGQGTIFKVYWPIMEEEIVAEADHELQPAKGGSEVILLAEDNKQIREIASRQLRKAGYTVIDAVDGREALEKAAAYQGTIDLLFTDVIMPVMGGKELSGKMRELYPDILTLYASGYTDSDIHQDIITLGKNRFINKPYSKQDILIRIRQLLDNKES
ncbi:MAG: response regulator, partial [Pseudomonadota bacterium]|nr:response regulator [Pseudomonadota bacterium]